MRSLCAAIGRLAAVSHTDLIAAWCPGRMHGSDGNARLTSATAVVLLVLLAGEGVTIVFIGRLLRWHEILGLVLIAPLLLKLGSVGWRFVHYYRGVPDYVAKGPPQVFLRFVVGPLTVLATVVLFASGVALIAFHIHSGIVVGLHKVSFVIWLGAMSVHVLAHFGTVWRWLREALTSQHETGSLRSQPDGHAARR